MAICKVLDFNRERGPSGGLPGIKNYGFLVYIRCCSVARVCLCGPSGNELESELLVSP